MNNLVNMTVWIVFRFERGTFNDRNVIRKSYKTANWL